MEYTTKVYEIGNCTAIVHRPVLTDEERKKREDSIKRELEHFFKAVEREKRNGIARRTDKGNSEKWHA